MTNNLIQQIYGRQPVLEAIKSGLRVEKIFLMSGSAGDFEKEIRSAIVGKDITLVYVPREKLNRMTKSNHQGVIAILNNFEYIAIDDLLQKIKVTGTPPLLLMLDQITDVRNFGAIARSALITGCHGIIIQAQQSVSVTDDAMKASAGALAILPVCKVNSLADCADHLAQQDIMLFASDAQGNLPLHELALNEPCCIVMGSENTGVSKAILGRSDQTFFIPQNNQIDSFNVSVAAGIILYQSMLTRAAN